MTHSFFVSNTLYEKPIHQHFQNLSAI